MQLLQHLYSRWQRWPLVPKICWVGLLLLFTYFIWHTLFINGAVPGPYPVVAFFHNFFLLAGWCSLFLMGSASFIFPAVVLKKVRRRWLKIIALTLLAIVSMTVLPVLFFINGGGLPAVIFFPYLVTFFQVLWIIIVINQEPQRFYRNRVIAFSVLVGLTIGLMPFKGYSVYPVDAIRADAWGTSYHLSYMNFDAQGQLSLYECGPHRLLCRKIYHYCNDLGPKGAGELSWANGRLTLTLGSTELYQRFKLADNTFDEYIDPAWRNFHSNEICRYSLWG